MRRRDVPGFLMAAGAGANLSPGDAAGQQGISWPIYPPTRTEVNFDVKPKNMAYPEGDARRYGAIGDGIADDTSAIQEAIDFCVKSGTGLLINGRFLITSPINIDRPEGHPNAATYFIVSTTTGGGFSITKNISLFSSRLAFTDAPVSALIYFRGVYFESAQPGMGFVLDDGRFLRIRFDGCSFYRILACNCTIRYSQSIQFTNCNIRFGRGTFWTSGAGRGFSTDDFRFLHNIVEAWNGDVINLGIPIGCSISNNLMEGISGTAIITSGAQGLLISGNYFEANGLDLDTTSGRWPCHGLAFIGNRTHPKNAKTESVIWSDIGAGCISVGNYSGGNLHRLPGNANIHVDDFAAGSIWNNPPLGRQVGASWTPIDSSGADLNINASGTYSVMATKVVQFELEATYPVTPSLAPARIGGLPFTSASSRIHSPIVGGTSFTDYTSYIQIAGEHASTSFSLYNLAAVITNAALSGRTVRLFGHYVANI
jgi:hypothetical protein